MRPAGLPCIGVSILYWDLLIRQTYLTAFCFIDKTKMICVRIGVMQSRFRFGFVSYVYISTCQVLVTFLRMYKG